MSPKNKKAFTPNKVSGMNVEEWAYRRRINQPSAAISLKHQPKQLMNRKSQGVVLHCLIDSMS